MASGSAAQKTVDVNLGRTAHTSLILRVRGQTPRKGAWPPFPALTRRPACVKLLTRMPTRHILLVEDEAPLREVVAEQLTERGFHVEQAASGEEAIDRLASFAFDIVITDLRLGGGADGTAVLDEARAVYPDIIGIIITGYGTVKDAVEAIKRGASDFIQKPFQFDELLHIVNTALEQRRLRAENAYLRKQLEERYRFEGIIGKSTAMRELFALLETVAQTSSTILVTGETGTGKELVAHAIHHNSPRRAQRFVAIQLRRHSRDAARGGALRPRARRVHRRRGHAARALRGGQPRHDLPRRGRHHVGRAADEAAARHPGPRGAAPRRPGRGEGGRAHHRRHQSRPGEDGGRGRLPRGPVLSPRRDPRAHASAARSQGRCAAARAAFPEQVRRRPCARPRARHARARHEHFAGRAAPPDVAQLAGQRARAGERPRARRGPHRRAAADRGARHAADHPGRGRVDCARST